MDESFVCGVGSKAQRSLRDAATVAEVVVKRLDSRFPMKRTVRYLVC